MISGSSWDFSIDPETARDLDDALSVELLPEGDAARIGVHIADVTHFVRAGTPLDEEAASRATSVYMVDGVLPMLPRLLCEQLCSLQPGAGLARLLSGVGNRPGDLRDPRRVDR